MNRRSISMILGGLLAATYAWQMFESYATGDGLRWLHIAGLLAAIALVLVAAKGGPGESAGNG
jgi:hypothetical protein